MSRRDLYGLTLKSLLFALGAASAWATPTISITAPAPSATPLYDVRPTITVAFASDDPKAPIDPATLHIIVNGVEWTQKFTVQPGSASYALSAQDALIAGKAASCSNACALRIEASIADSAGAQVPANVTYDVGPTLQALSPSAASYGSTLRLSALGLDPDPSHDAVLFSGDAYAAPFTSVDPATNAGTLTVAPRAVTGRVSITVNGVPSRESYPFTLLTDFPSCASSQDDTWMAVQRMISMADGSLFVWMDRDLRFTPIIAPCPSSAMQLFRYFPQNPDGSFTITDMSVRPTQSNPSLPEQLVAIGVDKTGRKPAVVTSQGQYVVNIHYHENLPTDDHVTEVDNPTGLVFLQQAEFDQDGNLYLAGAVPGHLPTLYVVSKDNLKLDKG